MLSVLYFVVIAVLGVLAFTRHRIFVICGFYSFYALLTILNQGNAPPHLGPITVYRALYLLLLVSIASRFLKDPGLPAQIRRLPLASYFFLLILVMASFLYSQTTHTFFSEDAVTVWDVTIVCSLFWM